MLAENKNEQYFLQNNLNQADEYITIIAPSVSQAMRQFKERGLDSLGYVIVGKVVRQQFALVGLNETADMFEGNSMVSATWKRKSAN